VQVYDEVELPLPDFEDELAYAPDGDVLRPVAQRDAVYGERLVCDSRHLHDGRGRAPDRDRYARAREPAAHGRERGQTQDYVAQLAEVYDEYVARLEAHRVNFTKRGAPVFRRP
jgi:hypothetical protein